MQGPQREKALNHQGGKKVSAPLPRPIRPVWRLLTPPPPRSSRLASYLEAEPNRQAAAAQATQAKLDELNAEIARLDAAANGQGGGGGKRRLEDSAYVEQSRAMVEGVKDAVREAMLAKRKKAKLAAKGGAVEESDVGKGAKVGVEVERVGNEASKGEEPKGQEAAKGGITKSEVANDEVAAEAEVSAKENHSASEEVEKKAATEEEVAKPAAKPRGRARK